MLICILIAANDNWRLQFFVNGNLYKIGGGWRGHAAPNISFRDLLRLPDDPMYRYNCYRRDTGKQGMLQGGFAPADLSGT